MYTPLSENTQVGDLDCLGNLRFYRLHGSTLPHGMTKKRVKDMEYSPEYLLRNFRM